MMSSRKREARLVAYARVSTDEQELSLESQDKAMRVFVNMRPRFEIVGATQDIASGKDTDRPGLNRALDMIDAGDADGLIVARLDRLTRSVKDAAEMIDGFHKADLALVILDPMVDTTTPYGRAFAQMAAVFAQLERELISQRTREGLAAARARGVRMGAPVRLKPEVRERLLGLRDAGMTYQQIADELTLAGIPTPTGLAIWNKAAVWRIVSQAQVDKQPDSC